MKTLPPWRFRAHCLFPAILAMSCSTNPAAPSVAQVAGTWRGTATLIGVTGGECVGEAFAALVGTSAPLTLVISQTGSTLTTTTAPSCSFTGTADISSFTLTATPASCPGSIQRDFPCPTGGAHRDVAMVEQTLSGTITANTISMTIVEKDNVFAAGSTSVLSVLTTTATAVLNR